MKVITAALLCFFISTIAIAQSTSGKIIEGGEEDQSPFIRVVF